MNYQDNDSVNAAGSNATAAMRARSCDSANESTDYISSTSVQNGSRLTMFASEAVLRRYWDTPEEDEAWAHLQRARS
jgi:hypothetical protein